MKKDIVVFWGNLNKPEENVLRFTSKTDTYLKFFQYIQDSGANLYMIKGINFYEGHNTYRANWKFNNGVFEPVDEIVHPYKVLDKAGSLAFPTPSEKNVFNTSAFKFFCRNKWQSYLELSSFFKKTVMLDTEETVKKIPDLIKSETIVLKPVEGMKGKNIHFIHRDSWVEEVTKVPDLYKKYLAQEFMDTSGGIPNLVSGMHDLRIVLINDEIVWAHIRQPGDNSLKANVADGGSINEIEDLSTIPAEALEIVDKIKKQIREIFGNCFYSIDMGYENGKYYLFELNSQLGFPRPGMKNADNFCFKLADLMLS